MIEERHTDLSVGEHLRDRFCNLCDAEIRGMVQGISRRLAGPTALVYEGTT